MLVLSRKRNEKIVIGEEITVTVLEVRGDQVQIGIDAPRTIPVHRHEVYVAIHEADEAAGELDPGEGGQKAGNGSQDPESSAEDDGPS